MNFNLFGKSNATRPKYASLCGVFSTIGSAFEESISSSC